jgi:hypothetical protein
VSIDAGGFFVFADRRARRSKVRAMTVLRNPKHAAERTTQRRRRPTRVDTLIRQAEKAGKVVTSITTPDGVTLRFGDSDRESSNNSWDEVLPRASH